MDNKFRYLVIFVNILNFSSLTSAETYTVTLGTDGHVNLVDSRFLSFTIDPKYLFSSSEKYTSKECICMATSLTPAYIRIAGPSTTHMTFKNTTIAIDDGQPKKFRLSKLFRDDSDDHGLQRSSLAVTHEQWEKFVQWAKNAGFDLVFALNSDEKTTSGMWDPNTALKILTVADEANVGEIFWQLGYECANQSIEEYLNDLETLRVIIETFPPGKSGSWHVVGGDVTHCLHADSKSDFKDYVTLSNDMMDAILLNGNSSSQELERMTEKDRYQLLKLLSSSETPLWLTEHSQMISEFERAADWMTSLGYSARNGFSVHYRELMEKELYEPTLSFYMALLFKNLVGERVLSVDIEASQAILFAHCTSLRHKPVSGAVTFYGINLDGEPARFSIKMNKKEEEGDIMQFILGHNQNGNIVVNGKPMYYEGDIRPVVKRVRPYKTLLINLPPKSFGFWVLANTQIKACYNVDDNKLKEGLLDIIPVSSDNGEEEDNFIKTKRSSNRKTRSVYHSQESVELIDGSESFEIGDENKALKERINSINNDLKKVHRIFRMNTNQTTLNRLRRQARDDEYGKPNQRLKKYKLKSRNHFDDDSFRNNILVTLSKLSNEHFSRLRSDKFKNARGIKRSSRIKLKRHLKSTPKGINNKSYKAISKVTKQDPSTISSDDIDSKIDGMVGDNLIRKRRSVNHKSKSDKKYDVDSSENKIDEDSKETFKLGKILHKLKKISELPIEVQEKEENEDYDGNESTEGIIFKTKISDDSAVIDISEKSHSGLLKSTLQDVLSLLTDFNKNINRLWTALTILE